MPFKAGVERVTPQADAAASRFAPPARPTTGEFPPSPGREDHRESGGALVARSALPHAPRRAGPRWHPLPWVAALALLAAVAWPILRQPLVANALRVPAGWDFLGREPAFQQASGFAALGLFLLGLLLPLRRRLGKRGFGSREAWRAGHAGLGIGLALALVTHSGGRLGQGANLVLSVAILSLVAVGALLGMAWRRSPPQPRFVGRRVRPLHLLLLWPTLGLIVVHVLMVYYF